MVETIYGCKWSLTVYQLLAIDTPTAKLHSPHRILRWALQNAMPLLSGSTEKPLFLQCHGVCIEVARLMQWVSRFRPIEPYRGDFNET
jgi:hypothetical protein